ncbi:MAG: hypothetical protein AB1467_01070 [Candidatus Diapherotrites archaeon]
MFLVGEAVNAANTAQGAVSNVLAGNWMILLAGIIFIIAAVVIFFVLKHLIANTVLGLIAWAIIHFVFHIELPFIATLIVTVIFGLAGLGVMVVLKFLGAV